MLVGFLLTVFISVYVLFFKENFAYHLFKRSKLGKKSCYIFSLTTQRKISLFARFIAWIWFSQVQYKISSSALCLSRLRSKAMRSSKFSFRRKSTFLALSQSLLSVYVGISTTRWSLPIATNSSSVHLISISKTATLTLKPSSTKWLRAKKIKSTSAIK